MNDRPAVNPTHHLTPAPPDRQITATNTDEHTATHTDELTGQPTRNREQQGGDPTAAARVWTDVGEEFLRHAYEDGARYRRTTWNEDAEWDRDRERRRISEQIDQLSWREPTGSFPFSPGMLLQEVIRQMRIPRVSAVAINGMLHVPDGPETATYGLYGVEAEFRNMRVRIYLLDIGTGAVPLAIDENVPPVMGQSEQADAP